MLGVNAKPLQQGFSTSELHIDIRVGGWSFPAAGWSGSTKVAKRGMLDAIGTRMPPVAFDFSTLAGNTGVGLLLRRRVCRRGHGGRQCHGGQSKRSTRILTALLGERVCEGRAACSGHVSPSDRRRHDEVEQVVTSIRWFSACRARMCVARPCNLVRRGRDGIEATFAVKPVTCG